MKALIVIDVQNDFVTGALGTKQAVAILPNLKSKIDAGIAAGDEIIFTRDTHGADYADTNEGRHLPVPHCIKGTEGWQVVREIDRPDCVHIDKPTFGYTDCCPARRQGDHGDRDRRRMYRYPGYFQRADSEGAFPGD